MKSSKLERENSAQQSTMATHKINHKHNVTLKISQKDESARSRELNNGDITYYVRWTDINGERRERKVDTKANGWSEKKACLKRIELINEPHTPANITLNFYKWCKQKT